MWDWKSSVMFTGNRYCFLTSLHVFNPTFRKRLVLVFTPRYSVKRTNHLSEHGVFLRLKRYHMYVWFRRFHDLFQLPPYCGGTVCMPLVEETAFKTLYQPLWWVGNWISCANLRGTETLITQHTVQSGYQPSWERLDLVPLWSCQGERWLTGVGSEPAHFIQ